MWNQRAEEVGCAATACDPFRLAVDFDGEEQLAAAGWRRAAGGKGAAAFAGGAWTAPAGEYDEWLQGPTAWGRLVDGSHGWAVTATVQVRARAAPCTPSTPGPGLRLSGDLGAITLTLLPDGPQGTTLAKAGAPYTVRLEGHGRGASLSVDGTWVMGVGLSEEGWTSPPAIEFGQLGCSHFESRWDRLVVEANVQPCEECAPDEHPMLAAVRLRVPGSSPARGTADASSACLAYSALDRAIRVLVVSELVKAGQADRAAALARLDPLTEHSSIEIAARELGEMGAPLARPLCDPVRSGDECNQEAPPAAAPVPAIVDLARRQFPSNGWVDHTATGRERILAAALAVHEAAGPPALAALLERLTLQARAGGTCAPPLARAR
jgi:hypothetical protein